MRLPTLSLLAVALLAPAAAKADEFVIGNRDVPALIRALQNANSSPGPHVIHLHPGGLYTLQLTDSANLGLPAIRSEIRIEGHGAEIRRYSEHRMTLLEVAEGGRGHLLDTTLAEGSLGALRNRGQLTLDRVSITDSSADSARAIVLNYGDLRIRESLIGYNHVRGMGRDCGIVLNLGRLEIRQSRFVENAVTRTAPEAAAAGAILNFGQVTADRLEFSNNEIQDPFGGLAFSAVVNLDSGQVEGLDPATVIYESASPL